LLIDRALGADEIADYKSRVVSIAGRIGRGVMNLSGRDARFLDLVQHPVALALADHQLAPISCSRAPTRSSSAPGRRRSAAQRPGLAPPPWPHPLTMNIVWMLDDFTSANGATRLIPESHRWNVATERGVRSFQDWLNEPVFLSADGSSLAAPSRSRSRAPQAPRS
jgi:hypothetical protein